MSTRRERLTIAAMSALLHAPHPLADGGLEAWQELGQRYRSWFEEERNGLVGELLEALRPDEDEHGETETTH